MSTVTMPKPTADNSEEFEGLFREHYLLVYRTACVVTGSPEDAEDVLQTIFLRLLKRAVSPDFKKNPKGYFYKAAVNVSLNTIRARRQQQLSDADLERMEAPQRGGGPELQDTIHKRLRETMATLSPRTVEILVLRYVHEYTEAEIGKLLGRSRGTIAVTLFRARTRLRNLLRASSGEER